MENQLEYNTGRGKLAIFDYGRNVYKMIDWAKGLESKEKRNEAAAGIVAVMGMVNPQDMDRVEHEKMLWNHLMIMSHWELDVDVPYEVQRVESVSFQPERIPLKEKSVEHRHYGRLLEEMASKVGTVKEDEGGKELVADIARRMKFNYLNWNHNAVERGQIENDLKAMSLEDVRVEEQDLELAADLMSAVGTMKYDELSPKRKKKK